MNDSTLRDYIRILFKQKAIIITTCVVVTLVVVLGLMMRTRMYQSDVKMLVSGSKQVEAPYYKELFAAQQNNVVSLTQIQIVTSNPVLERAVSALKLYEKPIDYEAQFASPLRAAIIKLQTRLYNSKLERVPPPQRSMINFRRAVDDLRKSIAVEPVKDTNIFIIHVRDFDRIGAAVLANVVSRSYMIFDLEQQLAELKLKYGPRHPIVMQLKDNIADMSKSLNGNPLPNSESIGPASVKVIEQASVPLNSEGKPKTLLAIIAMIMSLLFGIVLAFLFEYMDQTVKTCNEIESTLQLPVIGSVPYSRSFKKEAFIKSFVQLAEYLRITTANNSFKSVLIVAGEVRTGVSTITFNLANALANFAGKRVVVIDANLRQPTLHKSFNLNPEFGLADVLTEKSKLDLVSYKVSPNLVFIPAGKTTLNPVTLLDSEHMKRVLSELNEKFDLILIDSPQLNTFNEGQVLATLADKTIFVVAENRSRRQVVTKTLASLKDMKANILGVIFNCRIYPIPKFIYDRV